MIKYVKVKTGLFSHPRYFDYEDTDKLEEIQYTGDAEGAFGPPPVGAVRFKTPSGEILEGEVYALTTGHFCSTTNWTSSGSTNWTSSGG